MMSISHRLPATSVLVRMAKRDSRWENKIWSMKVESAGVPHTLRGGTSRIASTFCREQGTYHSAALLASFLAPAFTEKRVNSWKCYPGTSWPCFTKNAAHSTQALWTINQALTHRFEYNNNGANTFAIAIVKNRSFQHPHKSQSGF